MTRLFLRRHLELAGVAMMELFVDKRDPSAKKPYGH